MDYTGRTVYTVDARTNLVDIWECKGEFAGGYHGAVETLCMLEQGKKRCILPKRCVFPDHLKALSAAKKVSENS